MRKSQLIELIETLSDEEWAAFTLFLKAEFHNRSTSRKDILDLWAIICEDRSVLDWEEGVTGSRMYALLYPEKNWVVGKLDKLASELKGLLRTFLLFRYHEAEENQLWEGLDWAKLLRTRKLDNQYELHTARLEKTMEEYPQQDMENLLLRFLLEADRYYYAMTQNVGKSEENLARLVAYFWQYSDAQRLDLSNLTLLLNHILRLDNSNKGFDRLLSIQPHQPEDSHKVLFFSQKINELLKKGQPSREDFFQLMALLNQYEPALTPKAVHDYYTYLRNFCTILVNNDHPELLLVLHEIQKANLSRGYLYEDGQLGALTFLNINLVAQRLNDFEWALQFVELHRGRIAAETKDEPYYFTNLSYCYFHLGRFEDALAVLPPACDNLVYALLAKRLEIMCYFELQSDLAHYKIKAFKMYLRRANDKFLSQGLYEANMGFANMTQQILESDPGDRKRAERLIKRIQEKGQLANPNWLLAKSQAIKQINRK